MAIPASEQWTALFLPQLLFAADPERLHSRGPTPTALLIEDRIAARNREAVRLGVRRFMNAKEALLQTPALQLERSGQLIGQELSSILLSIAQSFGAALLLQAPNSGAAAIIVHADQSALQQLLDTVLRLKFEAFGGSGSSPQNALSAAVKEAQSVQADYDAQALLMHTVLKENLIAKHAPETFRLRIGVPSFNFKLQLERLEAAFAAWTKNVKTNAVSCTIRAYDPVGRILSQTTRPNGLVITKVSVPLGVIGIIYESRPNVTVDAAGICLKAGNAVILRGGSEALRSNIALAKALCDALAQAGLPADAAQLVSIPGHEAVNALCKLDRYIDVIIPRGGEGLVRAVTEAATMPVLKHYMGVCHLYIDEGADLGMALRLAHNGKVQRPGVCNALECLLVHEKEAAAFLPMLAGKLGADGVEFRADARSLPLLSGAKAVPARPGDFGQEFHDLILAVRVVDSLDDALDHIASYGSNHTEVICTNNHANATRFLREADASLTAVNASTRFNDGGQLGLGAEIGICTSKLHSYGAMGVRELTTTKFVALGTGQIRE